MKKYTLIASILLITTGFSNLVWAQVPPSAQPGIVTKGLELPDRAKSKLEDALVMPEEERIQPVEGGDEKVFILRDVVLENAESHTAKDFEGVFASYLGQKVSFSDLNAIAQGMTRKYREDGYVFSRVILPPQKVEGGVLRVRALEGRIGKVELTGNYKDDHGLIRAFADKIETSGHANTKTIERYLLLIDDLPGISAKALMQPSTQEGAGDLMIAVEQDPFEGSVSLDNRSSRFVGPWRMEAVGAFNSVFGIHDRTTVRALTATQTDELKFGEIMHEEQIGTEGMRARGRLAFTATEPGGSISNLGIDGDSVLFDLEALYPMVRSRRLNVNWLGGYNHNDTETDLAAVTIAEDSIRSVRAGARLDLTDTLRGVTQLEAIVTKGLDVFGATNDGAGRSRTNGEHDFLKANATLTRLQELPVDHVALYLSGTAQASRDALLASEEFTGGGGTFGRAYDAGEIAGDRGYAGLAELRYSGAPNHEILKTYQAYAFIDYARIKNIAPVAGEVADDSVTSAGLGTRFNLADGVSGFVEFATPMTKPVNAENDDDSRVFINILKRF